MEVRQGHSFSDVLLAFIIGGGLIWFLANYAPAKHEKSTETPAVQTTSDSESK